MPQLLKILEAADHDLRALREYSKMSLDFAPETAQAVLELCDKLEPLRVFLPETDDDSILINQMRKRAWGEDAIGLADAALLLYIIHDRAEYNSRGTTGGKARNYMFKLIHPPSGQTKQPRLKSARVIEDRQTRPGFKQPLPTYYVNREDVLELGREMLSAASSKRRPALIGSLDEYRAFLASLPG